MLKTSQIGSGSFRNDFQPVLAFETVFHRGWTQGLDYPKIDLINFHEIQDKKKPFFQESDS